MFSHTKARLCGDNWLFMERLLDKDMARCREVISIPGFPYLRGTAAVLEMAGNLGGKQAMHEWLELLRRIDLQARYAELSMLSDHDIESFCKQAGINCFQGRIRSYVARCSAIIMGDEKRNHGFMDRLMQQASLAVKARVTGTRACFTNANTLDGLVTGDVLNRILSPGRSSGSGSTSYLERRIQRSKQAAETMR